MKKIMMLVIIFTSLFSTSYAFEEGLTSSIRDEAALANSATRLFNQVLLTRASNPESGEAYKQFQEEPNLVEGAVMCDKLVISTLRFDIIEIRWAFGDHDTEFFEQGGGQAITLADDLYLAVNGTYSVYIDSIIGVSVVKTITIDNIAEEIQGPLEDPVIFLLHSNAK